MDVKKARGKLKRFQNNFWRTKAVSPTVDWVVLRDEIFLPRSHFEDAPSICIPNAIHPIAAKEDRPLRDHLGLSRVTPKQHMSRHARELAF